MTAAWRLRLVIYGAALITLIWMFQGVANTTRPHDNRPKPGPTAPPRPGH